MGVVNRWASLHPDDRPVASVAAGDIPPPPWHLFGRLWSTLDEPQSSHNQIDKVNELELFFDLPMLHPDDRPVGSQ